MFSQIVTRAKGLFQPGRDSAEASPSRHIDTSNQPEAAFANQSKMVTATRRRTFGGDDDSPTENVLTNGLSETNGKRKPESVNSASNDTPRNKRRKKASPEVEDEAEREETTGSSMNGAHVRFDSEEPVLPEVTELEGIPSNQEALRVDTEDDSDDEAPEAVDNSAILSKIRSEAKKQEKARQIEEQLQKEKRRKLDEKRKLQAKSSTKKKEVSDDLVSESSATLQGSYTQDIRRSALPALLPDDVLNAIPEMRPPTPPPETMDLAQKKPTKLRFLDKKEKAPKDVRMGDVTIRVLGEDGSRKKSGTTLPPKASKPGRSSRENWLQQTRSTGYVNGLRRTGGSKGFVRK